MCFSGTADVIGGIAIGAVGVDVLRHVSNRREQLALAALPILFAAHQLDEAVVWFSLEGRAPWSLGRVALWLYLLFAFVVLPVYVPLAVRRVEAAGIRRRCMAPFVGLGAAVSLVLLFAMLEGPVTARLAPHHLAYGTSLPAGGLITSAYVLATCGTLLLSSRRPVLAFGAVNLVAVAVLARLTTDGFASMWCAWAAVSSLALATHLRFPPVADVDVPPGSAPRLTEPL
jgi:hypothetical protein